MRSDSSRVGTALELIEAGYAMLSDEAFDTQTLLQLLAVQSRLEAVSWKAPAVSHTLIARLVAEADPKALGAKNLADLLATRLRISIGEARSRIKDAKMLGPRQSMTGEPLAPALPNVAAAQARGAIGPEHVQIIKKFFDKLPAYIDATTREQAEADLARDATGLGPTDFRKAADHLALLLNQDGDPPDHAEQARRRYLKIDKPGPNGLSRLHGLLDPEAVATLEPVFAKLGAPGRCNPDDHTPSIDDQPDDATIRRDTRSQGQRHHDALNTACEI